LSELEHVFKHTTDMNIVSYVNQRYINASLGGRNRENKLT